MRFLLLAAALAAATASILKDDLKEVVITKEPMVNVDVKVKEICILKLFNHILQPTMYDDVRDIAKEWVIEENLDKYLKVEVVKDFIEMYKMGMLPRGEFFVNTNEKHIKEAIKVFRLLYFAKDFDTFIRTACWLRERINPGMFVYTTTVAVFHRTDCNGIILPAPYEIYPYLFVDSNIIEKAQVLKMTKGWLDPILKEYHGITIKDNKLAVIDWRKGVRHTLTKDDRLSYFTEDIDLNSYMFYMHINYPFWMNEDTYSVNKERRGEVVAYMGQQLLARLRLERLSHGMCDITPLSWTKPIKKGYWPKLTLHTGEQMPVRQNYVDLVNEYTATTRTLITDIDLMIRQVVINGGVTTRDGVVITLKKPEDFETFARAILSADGLKHDDAKALTIAMLLRKLVGYSTYNMDKYTYIPTAIDMYQTCLRDPLFWKLMKRVTEYFAFYKKLLPKYTRKDFDFPGVKVESVTTDKLVTFMDEYDLDITNAVYLDQTEMQKRRSDMVYAARMRRLNHHPFKVTIDVVSDKAIDSVVRIFLGPKFDCMGRLLDVNDKRLDMMEIDSFLYKLETGKNTIVRDSLKMHNVIQQRPWTRRMFEPVDTTGTGATINDSWWYKSRTGFPHRLLLPMGRLGGFYLQLYVIVTPVRTGLTLPSIDVTSMKQRHVCPWTTCIDTMPLGFPFDRPIDETDFFTSNMKFRDVVVYRKDLATANTVKDIDMSDMVMKRDDLTYLDSDMLTRRSYRDVMLMSAETLGQA